MLVKSSLDACAVLDYDFDEHETQRRSMSDKPLAQKLAIKEGYTVLFVNAPRGYKSLLGELPGHVTVLKEPSAPADVIQVFVADQKQLEEELDRLQSTLKPRGIIWVTYHKGTSKTKTDINRDTIAAYARSISMEGVAMVSVDEDWSAFRLKRV